MNFNPADCDKLRSLLEEAVKGIEEQMGVSLEVGRMSYSDNITVKLTASKVGEAGIAETKEWNDYKRYAKWEDKLEEDWLGQTFVGQDGVEHTIVGYKVRARKRPIQTNGSNGKIYTWPVESVNRHMKRQEKAAL